MGDSPVLPDYGGACISNVVPALLGPRRDGAAGVVPPERLATPTRSCSWCSTASAGSSCRRAASLMPALVGAWRRPDHHGGAVDDRDRADVDHAPACRRASTGSSATASTSHGEVLNVLRWSTPRGDARRAIPPESSSREPFLGQRPPVVTKAEFLGSGFTLAHLDARALTRLPHAVDAGHRGARRCSPAASRSSTRTTTASTRSPTSTGSASTTTPSSPGSTGWSATCSRCCRPAPCCCVTADHGQVDVGDNVVALDATCSRLVRASRARDGSAGCTPLDGRADDLLDAAVGALRATQAWVVSTAQSRSTRAGSARRSSEAAADRLGDVAARGP